MKFSKDQKTQTYLGREFTQLDAYDVMLEQLPEYKAQINAIMEEVIKDCHKQAREAKYVQDVPRGIDIEKMIKAKIRNIWGR